MAGKPSTVRNAVRDKMLKSPHLPDAAFMSEFNCSRRLVAYVRSELVKANKIPGGRRSSLPAELAEALMLPEPDSSESAPRSTTPLPSAAPAHLPTSPSDLINLANDFTDEDDEDTRKQLLRKVRAIALDPGMHPDTVLSAAQAYIKLKDAVRARSLGPGKPLNREAAVTRLTSLLVAVGATVALTAFERAFKGILTNATQSSGATEPIHSPNNPSASSGPAFTPGSELGTGSDEDSGRDGDVEGTVSSD